MKTWIGGLMAGLGLPVAVGGFFLWASSPRYAESSYDRIVAYTNAPAADPTAAADPTLTVVSYNIGYLSGLTNLEPVRRSRALFEQNAAIATAALDSVQPDLIGFQEIDLDSRRSFYQNQLTSIATALQMPFGALAINWDKRYVPFPYWPPSVHFGQVLAAQAILSRYPIRSNQRQVLEQVPDNPFYYNALYLDRVAQVAEIDLAGQPLVLINVHLEAFDTPTRRRQTQRVRQLAETYAQQGPVLLIGDFNSALNRSAEGPERSIQILLESPDFQPSVTDEALQSGQATFPSDAPEFRLDYIFYTPATLELLSAQVLTAAEQASDHRPVSAEFRLR